MHILKDIYLVIGTESENVQRYLSHQLRDYGANIILCACIDHHFVDQIEDNALIDVILIIINDDYEEDKVAFERLLDKNDIPILFHEALAGSKEYGFSTLAIKKLAKKLLTLSQSSDKNKDILEKRVAKTNIAQKSSVKKIVLKKAIKIKNNRLPLSEVLTLSEKIASDVKRLQNKVKNVWVLGASLGGPDATKRFLAKIPKGLPVAFVLAQHLGDGFIALFASQLDKITPFTVKEGLDGDILNHGEVALVPVDRQLCIDINGKIKLLDEAWQGHYNPSINTVIENVTQTFKKQSGVIIFTGMGNDGTLACQEFFKRNMGTIWAQSQSSCVMSSMPDAVRKVNIVSYSGSPEALALKIAEKYKVD